LISIKEDRNVTYLHDTSQTINQRLVDDYNLDRQITKDNFKNLPLGLQWDGGQLLIVNEHMLYDFPSLADNLIVLRNSPKVHLDHLIQRLHPKESSPMEVIIKVILKDGKRAVSPMALNS
jgi:competence protein ComEC